MGLIELLVTLMVICLILAIIYWVLTSLIHVNFRLVQIIMLIAALIALLWLLNQFGGIPNIVIGG